MLPFVFLEGIFSNSTKAETEKIIQVNNTLSLSPYYLFFLVPSILKFPNLPSKYKKKCQQVKKFVDFNQIENNESKFTFTGADYNELRTVNVITIDSL